MKKEILVGVITVSLASGAVGITQKTYAAIPVIDAQNIAQAVLTVTNTLTQIQNQLLELKSLDSSTLIAQITGITDQINQIKSTAQQAKGIMNQLESVEQKWQNTFGDMDTLFTSNAVTTPGAQIANSRNTSQILDQTYQDAYRTAKQTADIEQEWQTLQKLMDANSNAVGNKQSLQIQNSLISQQNALLMKLIQTQSATSAVLAATSAAQNKEDAQTTAQNKKIIENINNYSKPSGSQRGLL